MLIAFILLFIIYSLVGFLLIEAVGDIISDYPSRTKRVITRLSMWFFWPVWLAYTAIYKACEVLFK